MHSFLLAAMLAITMKKTRLNIDSIILIAKIISMPLLKNASNSCQSRSKPSSTVFEELNRTMSWFFVELSSESKKYNSG